MAVRETRRPGAVTYPIMCMIVCALAGGLITGLSFWVITMWPLPVSIAPYYEDSLFQTGFAWGASIGAMMGFILGFITDEDHFDDVTYD
jgi:hypothetical protein